VVHAKVVSQLMTQNLENKRPEKRSDLNVRSFCLISENNNFKTNTLFCKIILVSKTVTSAVFISVQLPVLVTAVL
jgi:hypothetical protein